MLANFTNLTHLAHQALVLGVVLGAVKGAFLKRRTAVDRAVTRRTNLKLGKLIKLDIYCVIRIALALGFRLFGL